MSGVLQPASIGRPWRTAIAAFLVAAGLACDSGQELEAPDQTLLRFAVEPGSGTAGQWVRWYVAERVLYREAASLEEGPFVAAVDCGEHAGISLRISEDTGVDALVVARILAVGDNADDDVLAEHTYGGSGEHHLVVIVTCPD